MMFHRSIGIVTIISFFMGAVITLQTAYNTENPIYPTYLIGLGCRDSIMLEFSSTIMAAYTCRKSEGQTSLLRSGTMKVTEQIDALELMWCELSLIPDPSRRWSPHCCLILS